VGKVKKPCPQRIGHGRISHTSKTVAEPWSKAYATDYSVMATLFDVWSKFKNVVVRETSKE